MKTVAERRHAHTGVQVSALLRMRFKRLTHNILGGVPAPYHAFSAETLGLRSEKNLVS